MDTFNLPSAIDSCMMHGRQLYCRLVFLLGMDPSLSIEIIAFWLLVEANGEVDFLRHINSFHGDNFTALVAMGKQFIDAMHGNPVDLKSGPAREFHKQVFAGICFILSNVCYKVLNDLRKKAMAIHHRDVEESPDSNYLVLRQYVKDQPHISTSYHQYQGDSSTSTRSMPRAIKFIEDMVRTRDGIQSVNAFSPDLGNMIPQQHKNTGLNISSRSIIMSTAVQNHQDTVKMRYGAQSMNAFSTDLDFISPQQQKAFGVKISSESDIHDLESLFSNCTISPKFPSEWDNRFHQSCPQQQKTFGGVNVSSESDIHDLELLFRNCTISPKFPSEWDNTFPQSRPQQQKTFGGVNMYSGSDIHDLESLFSKRTISFKFPSEWDNTFSQSSTMNMDPCVHSPIPHHSLVPEDDRTLFVTFSNGYPLTKEEVYNFFMSNFGDVESLSIEEPVELRPPQYALVTFGSLETVLLILDGEEKVKFLTGGKHLWARKYVPNKSHQKGKNKAWI